MRPLSTPISLRSRHWKHVVLRTVAGVILLLIMLPTIAGILLQFQLSRMGMGRVTIENIDINLFSGRVVAEGVGLYRAVAQLFYLERAEIDISMLSLLENRIHLEDVMIDGVSLTIQQESKEPLHIAGVAIPQGDTQSKSVVEEEPSKWQFGIDNISLSNAAFHIVHQRFSDTVTLDTLNVGHMSLWNPDYTTALDLELSLKQGRVSAHGTAMPFSSEATHKVSVTAKQLPLDTLTAALSPHIIDINGHLDANIDLQVDIDPSQRIMISQEGELGIKQFQLQTKENHISHKDLQLKSELQIADIQNLDTLKLNAALEATDLAVKDGEKKLSGVTLGKLSVNKVELIGLRELFIEEVAINDLSVKATRTTKGVEIEGIPQQPKDGPEKETSTSQVSTAQETPALKLRLNRFTLSGNNRLTFHDKSVKPDYQHTFIITDGVAGPIDIDKPDQPIAVKVVGKDDLYTQFNLAGNVKPLLDHPHIDLKLSLSNLDMPPTTPYLVQLLGYRIETGQLETDTSVKLDNNIIKSTVVLRMNQLKIAQEDPARMEETKSKTALPLNMALSLLRDDDDNIKLTLPIEGDINDPAFDASDIINTALGKALKVASVSYLKLLLQPYGSLITIMKLAGDAGSGIALDPVKFPSGSNQLATKDLDYINKLAQLMQKKELNMRLCGFANTEDLLKLTKGKVKVIPEKGYPALELLAKQRAESIKNMLVNTHGVPAKRLFICHPELDVTKGAKGRVELSL